LVRPGSNPAMTIGRWRRHTSPLAENTPLNPNSLAMRLMRVVRWNPSGRSRSAVAMVSGFDSTTSWRGPMRKRNTSP
jgi:hypothetical protein